MVSILQSKQWQESTKNVLSAVEEWVLNVLGPNWMLLRQGLYGPHVLVSSTDDPQWGHLDAVTEFLSGSNILLYAYIELFTCSCPAFY